MEAYGPIFESLPPLKASLNLVFYLMVGFFAIFTAIIYYHWSNYAMEKTVSRITMIAYLICTIPLLLIMGAIILII